MESEYLLQRRARMMGLSKPEPEKKKKPIAHFSKKREKKQREYRKIVSKMLDENNRCQVEAPGCTKIANGLHHVVKRSPRNLLDENNLIPCCNKCNLWIEENSQLSMQFGLVKSKFKK